MRLVKVTGGLADGLWEECEREAGYNPLSFGPTDTWAIYEGETVVGVVGANSFDWISRRCRGAVYVLAGHRGEGIGTWALRARNELLRNTYNLRRVEAASLTENMAATKMLEKAGAEREGTLLNAIYFNGAYRDMTLWAWRMD